MEKIITADGSITFRSELVDEPYHTKSGAREESFEKHARPLKVWEKEKPVIYDVCFGLGYNTAAAIDLILEKKLEEKITIYCFENDKEILKKIQEIEADFKSFPKIKEFIKNFLERDETIYEEKNLKFIMHLGDVREEIKKAKENADYIFFDPFSPKKQPELWEAEFIKDIFEKANSGAKLSTYSCARIVRDNLKNAGFTVTDGPTIGRRAPSTIAVKVQTPQQTP